MIWRVERTFLCRQPLKLMPHQVQGIQCHPWTQMPYIGYAAEIQHKLLPLRHQIGQDLQQSNAIIIKGVLLIPLYKINHFRIWLEMFSKLYWPGHIGSTAIDIAVKLKAAVPPARPSRPSVEFTPLVRETKPNELNSIYNFPRQIRPKGAGRGTNAFLH